MRKNLQRINICDFYTNSVLCVKINYNIFYNCVFVIICKWQNLGIKLCHNADIFYA